MRIISGIYKGKVIMAPANLPVRPTTDFAKTALFNIFQFKFDYGRISVLDLFAGTGNISYEFLSRGCSNITCVDSDMRCVNFIKETFARLKFEKAKVYKANVFTFLQDHTGQYDIIFADPPYELKETASIPALVFEKGLLKPGGWLVVEHQSDAPLQSSVTPAEERRYGNVGFSIYKNVQG